ncbi:MAG: hypothetical protein HY260_02050 [Chloroflexi bacterium]|nr:hypothetical protein [Chloroflexota bacterium]
MINRKTTPAIYSLLRPDVALTAPKVVPPPAVKETLPKSSPVAGLLIPQGEPLPPARRLVVLVAEADVNESELARRIWSLAAPRGIDVLYLGLAPDSREESPARRRLATLAAITRDNRIQVETRLDLEQDWQPGDLIVCHAEQAVRVRGLRRKPLAETILSARRAPVYVLSGFYPKLPLDQPGRWTRLIRDALPFGILVVFCGIQVKISDVTSGWVSIVLLCLSVLVELGLILAWNNTLH